MAGNAELVCSARGCRDAAAWALRWNNPRLHSPERRKTWLACDAHRADLEAFLGLRGLLRDTLPIEELPAAAEEERRPAGTQPGSAES